MIGLVHEPSMKESNACTSKPEQSQSLDTKQYPILSDGKFACSAKEFFSGNSTAAGSEGNIKAAGDIKKHTVINWREMGAFRCEDCSFTTTEETISHAHKTICRKRKRISFDNSYTNADASTKLSNTILSVSKKARTAKDASIPIYESYPKYRTIASASGSRVMKPKESSTPQMYHEITSEPSLLKLVSGQQAPGQLFQMMPGQQELSKVQGLQPLSLSYGSVTSEPSQLQFVSGQQPLQLTSGQKGVSGVTALNPFPGSGTPVQFMSTSQSDVGKPQTYYAQPVILMPVSKASNPQSGSAKSMTTVSRAIETQSSFLNAPESLAMQSEIAVATILTSPTRNDIINAYDSSDSADASLPKIVSTVSLAGIDHSFFDDDASETPLSKTSSKSFASSDVTGEILQLNDSVKYTSVSLVYVKNKQTVEIKLSKIHGHFVCFMCKVKTKRISIFQPHVHDHIHSTNICKTCSSDSTVEECGMLTDVMNKIVSHEIDNKQPRSTMADHSSEPNAIDVSSSITSENISKPCDYPMVKTPEQTKLVIDQNSEACNDHFSKIFAVENKSETPLKKREQKSLENSSSPETSSTSRLVDPLTTENNDAGSFYKCAFDGCQFSSLNSSNFLHHLLVNHRNDKCYPCAHCSVTCKDGNSLIQHMSCHVKCKKFILFQCVAKPVSSECDNVNRFCGFGTNDLAQFLSHVQTHHGTDPSYMCAKCDTVLDRAELLRDHLQANLLKFIQCPYCSAKDKNRRVILQHIGSEHSGKAKQIRVTSELTCFRKLSATPADKVTEVSVTNAEHADTETTECSVSDKIDDKEQKQFLCQYCDERFTAFSNFRLHVYDKHIIEEGRDHCIIQIFQCKYCTDYRTTCPDKVIDHVCNTHPSTKSGYKKMRFTMKKREAQQTQWHSPVLDNIQDKRFTCFSCSGATYAKYSSLKSHLYQEHLQKGEIDCLNVLLYKCDRCDYRSTSKHNVGRHVSQAHATEDILILKQNIKLTEADCLSKSTVIELNFSDNSEHNLEIPVKQGCKDANCIDKEDNVYSQQCCNDNALLSVSNSSRTSLNEENQCHFPSAICGPLDSNLQGALKESDTQLNVEKHENVDQFPQVKIKEEKDCFGAEVEASLFTKLANKDENDNSETSLVCPVLQTDEMHATNPTATEVYEHNIYVKQNITPMAKCIPQNQSKVAKTVLPISENCNDCDEEVDPVISVPNRINSTDGNVASKLLPSFGSLGLDAYFKDCYFIQNTGNYCCLFCNYITKGVVPLNNRSTMHQHLMGGKHLKMYLYRCGRCSFRSLSKTGVTQHSRKRHREEDPAVLPIENKPMPTLIAEYRMKLDAAKKTNDSGTEKMINDASSLMSEDCDPTSTAQGLSHLNSKSKMANLKIQRKKELNKMWKVKLVSKSNSLSNDVNAEVNYKPEWSREQGDAMNQGDDGLLTEFPEHCIKSQRMSQEDEGSSEKPEENSVKIEKESPLKKNDEVYGVISDDDDDDFEKYISNQKPEKELAAEQLPSGQQYGCHTCSFLTSSLPAFEEHLQKHIESPLNTVRQRCAYCCFSTKSQREFEMHRSTHVTQKSFSCIFCPYRAFHAYKIRQHCKMKHPTFEASVLEIASRDNSIVLRKEQDCNQLQLRPTVPVTDLYAMNTVQMKQLLQSENITALRLPLSIIKPVLKSLGREIDLVAL